MYFRKTGETVTYKSQTYYLYNVQEVYKNFVIENNVYKTKLALRTIGTACTTDTYINKYKDTSETFGG